MQTRKDTNEISDFFFNRRFETKYVWHTCLYTSGHRFSRRKWVQILVSLWWKNNTFFLGVVFCFLRFPDRSIETRKLCPFVKYNFNIYLLHFPLNWLIVKYAFDLFREKNFIFFKSSFTPFHSSLPLNKGFDVFLQIVTLKNFKSTWESFSEKNYKNEQKQSFCDPIVHVKAVKPHSACR